MKKVPPASPTTERAYAAISARLAELGVESSTMFGMPALKLGGKAFAGLFGDAMVFKLEAQAHADALALTGAELFDPSGMGRAMKAWVVLPPAHEPRWRSFADHALRSAAPGTAKRAGANPAKARPAAVKPTKARIARSKQPR
jgi:hypothetical protein